jgi:ferredoxin
MLRRISVRVIVDLVRCQSYGQCVYAAPTVFRFNGEESLEFDYAPDDALREQVERAVAACPVQAIWIGLPDTPPTEEQGPAARDAS